MEWSSGKLPKSPSLKSQKAAARMLRCLFLGEEDPSCWSMFQQNIQTSSNIHTLQLYHELCKLIQNHMSSTCVLACLGGKIRASSIHLGSGSRTVRCSLCRFHVAFVTFAFAWANAVPRLHGISRIQASPQGWLHLSTNWQVEATPSQLIPVGKNFSVGPMQMSCKPTNQNKKKNTKPRHPTFGTITPPSTR